MVGRPGGPNRSAGGSRLSSPPQRVDLAPLTRRPDGLAVLLVQDDADLLARMTTALDRAGLRTTGATNPEDAERALAAGMIGCVVADLGMPGMNGIDLVRTLRRKPETSTLPFILMTGSEDAEGVIEALDAGADDFLPKPVRLDELVARVKAHLRTQAAWTQVVIAELRTRAVAIHAIGQLAVSSVPEEAATAVVTELAQRIGSRLRRRLPVGRGRRNPSRRGTRARACLSAGRRCRCLVANS